MITIYCTSINAVASENIFLKEETSQLMLRLQEIQNPHNIFQDNSIKGGCIVEPA